MSKVIACFAAYASHPPSVAEVLEKAIADINSYSSGTIKIRGWKELCVGGKFIIDVICDAIDNSDLFICDLTTPNPNVLFELGYAIAKRKRVWITLDPSFPDSESIYDKLKLLTTVGYASYQNAGQLVKRFYQDQPYADLESTIFHAVVQSIVKSQPRQPALLYLKSRLDTESSVRLTSHIVKSGVPFITDDPQESISQPLAWYAQNAFSSCALIAHLLDEARDTKHLLNSKYAFVSGLAYGFDKPLLMLAHSPYKSPIDYRDLLKVHDTAAQCGAFVDDWLPTIVQECQKQRHSARVSEVQYAVLLEHVNLGEELAENERASLPQYFVPTALYEEARKAQQSMIYVGRKGTGKTANLLQIEAALQADRRYHVCTIMPVSYELEGVLNILRVSTSRSEQGFLIASLWKFLIYTELAQSIYNELLVRPIHIPGSEEEKELVGFVEAHADLIRADFTARLDDAIRHLVGIDMSGAVAVQRAKVSEILHTSLLSELRTLLGKVLEKKDRVYVLIDNLDKAWTRGTDLVLLSDFLFGLLGVSRVITEEFRKRGGAWRSVNLSLLVFLRSDIFSYLMREARERDKLPFRRLEWNDRALLQRVIEERLISSLPRKMPPDEIWETLFDPAVKGMPTKDYLLCHIIPRPRDVIYLCKAALNSALNQRHARITESDLLSAERDYSEYVFRALEAELSPQLLHIEDLLYEFAGLDEIVHRPIIEALAAKVGIPEAQVPLAIDLLCESTFLGVEVNPNRFVFLFDDDAKPVQYVLARKTALELGAERFRVNRAFHAYLEIRSADNGPCEGGVRSIP